MQPTARRGHRAGRGILTLGAALALTACSEAGPSETTGGGGGTGGSAVDCQPEVPPPPPDDYLPPTRVLRRIALSLTGRAPVASEYQALLDAKDEAASQAILDKAVDDALASPNFYEVMRDFGREWMA